MKQAHLYSKKKELKPPFTWQGGNVFLPPFIKKAINITKNNERKIKGTIPLGGGGAGQLQGMPAGCQKSFLLFSHNFITYWTKDADSSGCGVPGFLSYLIRVGLCGVGGPSYFCSPGAFPPGHWSQNDCTWVFTFLRVSQCSMPLLIIYFSGWFAGGWTALCPCNLQQDDLTSMEDSCGGGWEMRCLAPFWKHVSVLIGKTLRRM